MSMKHKIGMKVVDVLHEGGIDFHTHLSNRHKGREYVAEIIERETRVMELKDCLEALVFAVSLNSHCRDRAMIELMKSCNSTLTKFKEDKK